MSTDEKIKLLQALAVTGDGLGESDVAAREAALDALDDCAFADGHEAFIDGLLNLAAGNDALTAEGANRFLERMAGGTARTTIVRMFAARRRSATGAEQAVWIAIGTRLARVPASGVPFAGPGTPVAATAAPGSHSDESWSGFEPGSAI